ncbi:hypothetical protein [Anaeromyxobacter sp. SG64]|uniref:hypothetical protein n=1 Tax=Anaeromyxobacter sp. SG64 TaxID=2925409 RepID=UPI001F57E7C2|nr:hypothetical protein [Anaeromyxobacter sp. SG64]
MTARRAEVLQVVGVTGEPPRDAVPHRVLELPHPAHVLRLADHGGAVPRVARDVGVVVPHHEAVTLASAARGRAADEVELVLPPEAAVVAREEQRVDHDEPRRPALDDVVPPGHPPVRTLVLHLEARLHALLGGGRPAELAAARPVHPHVVVPDREVHRDGLAAAREPLEAALERPREAPVRADVLPGAHRVPVRLEGAARGVADARVGAAGVEVVADVDREVERSGGVLRQHRARDGALLGGDRPEVPEEEDADRRGLERRGRREHLHRAPLDPVLTRGDARDGGEDRDDHEGDSRTHGEQ